MPLAYTLTNLFLEKFYWALKKLSKLFQFQIKHFLKMVYSYVPLEHTLVKSIKEFKLWAILKRERQRWVRFLPLSLTFSLQFPLVYSMSQSLFVPLALCSLLSFFLQVCESQQCQVSTHV